MTTKNLSTAAGLVMLLVALFGVLFPELDRHPEAMLAEHSAKVAIANLDKLEESEFITYIDSVRKGVASATVPYWPESGSFDPRLRPSITKNWVLHAISYFDPAMAALGITKRHAIDQIEVFDYRAAIHRGVGQCSQYAMVFVDYLRQNGVEAYVVGLDGHVIAKAVSPEGQVVLFDRDIVMPFDLDFAQENIDVVKKMYVTAGVAPDAAEMLSNAFSPEGNQEFKGEYRPRLLIITSLTTIASWLIPLAAILIALPAAPASPIQRWTYKGKNRNL